MISLTRHEKVDLTAFDQGVRLIYDSGTDTVYGGFKVDPQNLEGQIQLLHKKIVCQFSWQGGYHYGPLLAGQVAFADDVMPEGNLRLGWFCFQLRSSFHLPFEKAVTLWCSLGRHISSPVVCPPQPGA